MFGRHWLVLALIAAGCTEKLVGDPNSRGLGKPVDVSPEHPSDSATDVPVAAESVVHHTEGPSTPEASAFYPLRTSPIVAENQLTGGTGWKPGGPRGISCYAASTSAVPGERVSVHAAADAAAVTAQWELWRLGYYGGKGGRLISSGGPVSIPKASAPVMDLKTGLIRADWSAALSLLIPANAVSGLYVIRLAGASASGVCPLVIREKTPAATTLMLVSVNTWHAYNSWGGASLYVNRRTEFAPSHAYAISFDRPYESGAGLGLYFEDDQSLHQFVEAQGYDVAYASDVDLDTTPELALHRRLLVVSGHSEYWSRGMRDAFEAAIAKGTNAAFFGANNAYWQVRFEDQRRTLTGYKEFASLDPIASTDLTKVTALWRDPRINRPENGLLGVMYGDWVWTSAPLIVRDPSHWIWSGTGVAEGTSIAGVYGDEVDRRFANGAAQGVRLLADGTVESYDAHSGIGETTIWERPSGGTVFAASSITWGRALTAEGFWDARIRQATANVLLKLGADGSLPAPLATAALPAGLPQPQWRAGVKVSTVTAALTKPTAVTTGSDGDAIVADGNRIVRVSGNGSIAVIAGTSTAGMVDGPSASARFNEPHGIAVSADGKIYVADTGNSRVRVIEGGTVSTLAGLWEGFAEGAGTAARFSRPMGISLMPSGSLLVADAWNHRLREVTPAGVVSTWVGNGVEGVVDGPGAIASLNFPIAVSVGADGTAVIAEAATGRVRQVSVDALRTVSTLAGTGAEGWRDGPLSSAQVSETVAVAVRAQGGVVLLDSASARLRVVQSGVVETLAGGARAGTSDGEGMSAAFTSPRGVAVAPDGSLLVVDLKAHALRRVTLPQ